MIDPSGNGTLVGLTKVTSEGYRLPKLVRLSAKPWSYLILAGSLLIILLVQVLPSVDLPDTAFQQGTEPTDVQYQSIAAPQMLMAILVTILVVVAETKRRRERVLIPVKAEPKAILVFEHSFRC